MTLVVKPCETAAEYAAARALFEEYAASLGFSLCFQGFDREITRLPAMYGPPGGSLLIVLPSADQAPAGCVGVRRFSDDTCEMKRLYVRDQFKGKGIGRRLAEEALAAGRRLGYGRVVLDTVPSMQAAQSLYRSLGFREIPAYYDGPCGALYMEKLL